MGFIINSIVLGVGLAMDAFSVSLADGLKYPHMQSSGRLRIAGAFGFFQFLMPLLGWGLVNTAGRFFTGIQPFIPWIGFFLLLFLGVKMLIEGIKERGDDSMEDAFRTISGHQLVTLAIATSIDALSVGFVIASYNMLEAFSASFIIGVVTFLLCIIGTLAGRRFGMRYSFASSILGGVILICIGVKLVL